MGDWFSSLFSGFGSGGAGSSLASSANTLGNTSSSMFPSVFNGGGSNSMLGLDSIFGNGSGINLSQMSNWAPQASTGAQSGGLFSNMSFDDLTNLGGLALGGLQYKQSRDAYKEQKAMQDEQMQNTRDDRAYNDEVRDRARNLRF